MSNKDDIVKELLDPTDPPYWNGGRWVGRKTDHVLKCEAASAITTLREQLNKEGAKFPCHMGEAAIGSPYKCPHCGATVGVTRTPFDDKRDGIPDRDLVVITLNDLVGKLLRLRTENATLRSDCERLGKAQSDRDRSDWAAKQKWKKETGGIDFPTSFDLCTWLMQQLTQCRAITAKITTENATLKAENTRLVQRHTDRVQKEHL